VNVFVPGTPYADRAALDRFRDRLLADPMMPTEPGRARYDDDAFGAKVALVEVQPVPRARGRRRPADRRRHRLTCRNGNSCCAAA
jgi:hypothetical protein